MSGMFNFFRPQQQSSSDSTVTSSGMHGHLDPDGSNVTLNPVEWLSSLGKGKVDRGISSTAFRKDCKESLYEYNPDNGSASKFRRFNGYGKSESRLLDLATKFISTPNLSALAKGDGLVGRKESTRSMMSVKRIARDTTVSGKLPTVPAATYESEKSIQKTTNKSRPSRPPFPLFAAAETFTSESPPQNQTGLLADRLEDLARSYAEGRFSNADYRVAREQAFVKYGGARQPSSTTGPVSGYDIIRGEMVKKQISFIGSGMDTVPKMLGHTVLSNALSNPLPPSSIKPPLPPRNPALLAATLSRSNSTAGVNSTPTRRPSLLTRARTSIRSEKSNKRAQEDEWNVVQPNRVSVGQVVPVASSPLNFIRAQSIRLSNSTAVSSDYHSRQSHQGRSLVSTLGSVRSTAATSITEHPLLSPSPLGKPLRPTQLQPILTSTEFLNHLSSTPPELKRNASRREDTAGSQVILTKMEILEEEMMILEESFNEVELNLIQQWMESLGPKGMKTLEDLVGTPEELQNVQCGRGETLPAARLLAVISTYQYELLESIAPSVAQSMQEVSVRLREMRTSRLETEEEYRDRLEYLRARLKGALLKEKLLSG